jgi:hypothetical protein
MHPMIYKNWIIIVTLLIFFEIPDITAQIGEIGDCNCKDLIVQVTVRSSNNQVLNLVGCTFVQGKLSDYLNCIKINNPTLLTTANLLVQLTSIPTSGIGAVDFSLLKQHVLHQNQIFNTCNIIGSDCNSDNKVFSLAPYSQNNQLASNNS